MEEVVAVNSVSPAKLNLASARQAGPESSDRSLLPSVGEDVKEQLRGQKTEGACNKTALFLHCLWQGLVRFIFQ